MGLLTIIRKQKAKDREIRVLVLGLDNAGKTTIINQIMGNDVHSVAPTMGFHINSFQWNGCHINAWDIGGQTTLRGFWSNYFDKSDAIIWTVDGTSLERLQESYRELREKVIQQDQLAGTLFCVVINKMDLVDVCDRDSVHRAVVAALNLENEIPHERYTVLDVSGKIGEGVGKIMDWIVTSWTNA